MGKSLQIGLGNFTVASVMRMNVVFQPMLEESMLWLLHNVWAIFFRFPGLPQPGLSIPLSRKNWIWVWCCQRSMWSWTFMGRGFDISIWELDYHLLNIFITCNVGPQVHKFRRKPWASISLVCHMFGFVSRCSPVHLSIWELDYHLLNIFIACNMEPQVHKFRRKPWANISLVCHLFGFVSRCSPVHL